MFLGEEFNEKQCDQMCDNCRKGLRVIDKNCTQEALKILEFVYTNSSYKCNVTLKMVVDLFRGLKLKKSFIK